MSLFSRLLGREETPAAVERPQARIEAGRDAPVTLYTTSWCGSCRMAKSYFKRNGVAYEEIDIERVPEAAEIVKGWARGYKTVPTMKIGETIVVDWDRKAVEAALRTEGLV